MLVLCIFIYLHKCTAYAYILSTVPTGIMHMFYDITTIVIPQIRLHDRTIMIIYILY